MNDTLTIAGKHIRLPAPLRGGVGGGGDGGALSGKAAARTPHPILPPHGGKESLHSGASEFCGV